MGHDSGFSMVPSGGRRLEDDVTPGRDRKRYRIESRKSGVGVPRHDSKRGRISSPSIPFLSNLLGRSPGVPVIRRDSHNVVQGAFFVSTPSG